MNHILFTVVMGLSFLLSGGVAPGAVLQSFDRLFQGDDPTESFTFTLPYDPSTPSVLRFDGFAENLAPDETGVRFLLRWGTAGTEGGGEISFPTDPEFAGYRLPGVDPLSGVTRVPLQFSTTIDYAPGGVLFVVEGLGPSDNFRFVGDLSLQPIPEPATWTLLALGGAAVLVARRRKKAVQPRMDTDKERRTDSRPITFHVLRFTHAENVKRKT